jgi:NADPH-dependent 2,4-dienoyl-CoA reductase/sulfur reductase-like enzyme
VAHVGNALEEGVKMRKNIVVVGGDAAGMSAASKARRTNPDTVVTVFERGSVASFSACGIPYYVGGVVADATDLLARSPEAFARAGIDVRTMTEVVAVDTSSRKVTVRNGAREEVHSYDELILATGATAIRPPIEGLDGDGVFTVRHYDDGVALGAFVDSHELHRATIVGAGYIGLEFAEALRTRGLDVTVVDIADQVFPGLHPDLAARVEDELVSHGVRVRTSEPLTAVRRTTDGAVRAVETDTDGWPADIVVVGGGARPATELARSAGIPLDAFGAIVTDDRLATPVDGVWAAGDVTATRHRVTGARTYVPLGPTANKQGRVAGENAAGGDATFGGIVGTSVVKVFDVTIARTGLDEGDCAEAGMDCVASTIDSHDRAQYYPGSSPLAVRLVGERGSGRLLGAQLVGGGAAKRVDVLATALHGGMTVAAVAELDLSYAPPYAPVWDPVLVAARQLVKELAE